jgi:hypothetical protein
MSKIKIIFLFFLIISFSAFSEYYAIGANLGSNKGLNILIYNSQEKAIQVNSSWSLNSTNTTFIFSFDQVYFSLMPDGVTPLYYGVGMKISNKEEEYIGVRGVFGASYFAQDIDENLELYIELDPTFHLAATTDFLALEIGLGFRYYF